MTNVIVAFSKPENAKNIKNVLMRSGFQVIAVCNSGAQALANIEGLNSGIIVCGYQLPDMMFSELHDCLPVNFSMLLVSSPHKLGVRVASDIVCIPRPIKVHDLVSTIEMMSQSQMRRKKKRQQQPKKRSEEERQLIAKAKQLLIERNNLSEEEAHRYIQKCSMDNGTDMIETAQMVISLMN